MESRVFLGALAALALAGTAAAQNFNIDAATGNAVPAATYSAATAQAGTWNLANCAVVGPTPIVDITGAPTAVGLTISNCNANFFFNNVGTTGNDELLMDDIQDLSAPTAGIPTTWTIGPLAAGQYSVTVYAWAPDVPADSTLVTITGGSLGLQTLAGSTGWTGFVLGQTHVRDTVVVSAGGSISFTADGATGSFGSVNGAQIELLQAGPVTYCTAKVNSQGCSPAIAAAGASSATASSGFVLSATQELNNKVGLVLYSEFGRDAAAFGPGGLLCVKAPTRRSKGFNSGGTAPPAADCTGVFSIDFNTFAQGGLGTPPNPATYLLIPGQVVTAQFWGRDPGIPVPNNFSLSNGIEWTVGP